ncbi:hypothetical protein QJS04_geneDACA015659 [Acorus gramineus]|uniref:Uncharacterized protein n=1 Tax=Acorus gramineus TaxID=55184 RepID=A0AAV9AKN0_ACOGR|nr:hypothetical protein QJS04_geneDACA015659 [Acorus gramineus]
MLCFCCRMMGTNYIGPFALTNHLLPLLKNSTVPSRIVNVTSFTHRCVFDAGINDEAICVKNSKHFPQSNQYPFAYIYELSKFYLLLFAYELHRRYYLMDPSCQISIMAADPGVVETNIMREVPPRLSRLAFTVLRFLCLLKSPKDGVESIIDAALAPPEASGEYFFGGKGRTIKSSSLSFDVGLAEALWVGSTKLFRETQLKLQVSMDA